MCINKRVFQLWLFHLAISITVPIPVVARLLRLRVRIPRAHGCLLRVLCVVR